MNWVAAVMYSLTSASTGALLIFAWHRLLRKERIKHGTIFFQGLIPCIRLCFSDSERTPCYFKSILSALHWAKFIWTSFLNKHKYNNFKNLQPCQIKIINEYIPKEILLYTILKKWKMTFCRGYEYIWPQAPYCIHCLCGNSSWSKATQDWSEFIMNQSDPIWNCPMQ